MKFQSGIRHFESLGRSFIKICLTTLVLVLLQPAVRAANPASLSPEEAKISKRVLRDVRKQVLKGRIAEAESTLRDLIASQPANSRAKLELANLQLKQKRLYEAYELSYEVVKVDKENGFGFAVLGNVLLASGDLRQSRLLLNNSLRLNPKEPLAWAGLGLVDFYENRISEAVEKLEVATLLDGREPDYAFSLGQVAARGERYDLAAESYRRFLDLAPPTDKDRRQRIEGLIRFLRYLGGKRELYDIDGTGTTVPMQVVRDRPIVPVRVNGKKRDLKFVLDTGSGISVISTRTAEALGIKPVTKGGMARAIGGSGRFEIVYGFLRSIDIGDVKVRNVPVYIRPFHEANEHIDGYIGLGLISKFLTTVDYPNSSFVLQGRNVADGTPSAEGVSFPLRLTSSGFLSGEVKVDGVEEPLNFIVDTGASISVISDELAATESLIKHVSEERLQVVGAAGVLDNVRTFNLPRVSLGPKYVERVRAVELDLDILNEASGFRQVGILGGNFLKNYRMTFDFKNARVVLEIERQVTSDK